MDILINGCTNLLFGQFQFVLSVLETDISSSSHLKSLEDPNMSTQNFIPLILDKKKKKTTTYTVKKTASSTHGARKLEVAEKLN